MTLPCIFKLLKNETVLIKDFITLEREDYKKFSIEINIVS